MSRLHLWWNPKTILNSFQDKENSSPKNRNEIPVFVSTRVQRNWMVKSHEPNSEISANEDQPTAFQTLANSAFIPIFSSRSSSNSQVWPKVQAFNMLKAWNSRSPRMSRWESSGASSSSCCAGCASGAWDSACSSWWVYLGVGVWVMRACSAWARPGHLLECSRHLPSDVPERHYSKQKNHTLERIMW